MTYRRRPLGRAEFSNRMRIPLDEALVLLTGWRNEGTPLRIHVSGAGPPQELRGTIQELNGTVVEVRGDRTKLKVDLRRADFEGDWSPPAYLICEFRNRGRYSFYVMRGEVGGTDPKPE
jgi:hypothetical protein